MSFAVLHMQKVKEPAIKGMQIHNQREKESQTNPDIEQDRSAQNYDLVNPEPIDYNKAINERIQEGVTTGKAVRKDAVRLASFMVTSDSSFFDKLDKQQEEQFFKDSLAFFQEKYGKENIAYAMVHKDEKTPHMHVGLVPITEDGRLSAKDYFGKKQQLHQLQDDFHEHVKDKGYELERGVSSDRKHLDTAKFKQVTAQQQIEKLEQERDNLKGEIQAYQQVVSRLDGQVKDLEAQEKQIKDYQSKMDNVESIETKTMWYKKGYVAVREDDLQDTLRMAQKAHVRDSKFQQDLNHLKEDKKLTEANNKDLRRERDGYVSRNNVLISTIQDKNKEIKGLEKENKALKQENKVLKSVQEFMKSGIQKVAEKAREVGLSSVSDNLDRLLKESEKKQEKQMKKVQEKEKEQELEL